MENIFAVEFEVNAQNYTDGRFSIPKKVVDVMGFKPGDRTLVEVSSAKGMRSFIVGIKSGNEIYGLQAHVMAGEAVTVRVTRVPKYID